MINIYNHSAFSLCQCQQPASPIISQPINNSPGSPEGSSFPTSLTISQLSVCGQHPGNPAISVHLIRPSFPVCSISGSSTELIYRFNSPVIRNFEYEHHLTFGFHLQHNQYSQHLDSAKASESSLSLHPPGSSTNPAQPAGPANSQPLTSGQRLRSPTTIDSVSVSNIAPSSATLADNHLCPCVPNSFCLLRHSGATLTMYTYPGKNSPSSVSLRNITN